MQRRTQIYVFLAAIVSFILHFGSGVDAASAQTPVKASGINNVWRGDWDGNKDTWTTMTVRTSAEGVAEVIFSYAKLRPYYNDKIKVSDGKSFQFTWGDSTLSFHLQPDGKLQGIRESKKHGRNEILMTSGQAKTDGLLGTVWEGNWGGSAQYWSVITVQGATADTAEVMMTYASGAPFYDNAVKVKERTFSFNWGPSALFEFALDDDGKTMRGTRKVNGQITSTVALKRMFQ